MKQQSIEWALAHPVKFFKKYSNPLRWASLVRTLIAQPKGFQQTTKNAHEQFQDICVNHVQLISHSEGGSSFEQGAHNQGVRERKTSLLIETRNLPQNEFVITNTIQRLGDGWDHVIYCSCDNQKSISQILHKHHLSATVRLLPQQFSRNDYNELLLSYDFWKGLETDWVLVYQTDTYLFSDLSQEFFKYDYIGAPWSETALPYIAAGTELPDRVSVGNGGLSLRKVSAILKVLGTRDYEIMRSKTALDASLTSAPEDVVFSYLIHKHGVPAPVEVAQKFSREHSVIPIHGYVFGCHQPYLSSEGDRVFASFKNRTNGVNVSGFVNNVLGLGQNARNIVAGLRQMGRPMFVNELVTRHQRLEVVPVTNNHWYQKNLVCCNPDYDYYSVLGSEYFNQKTNAALWAWELERVPVWWRPHADRFNILFTISEFCKKVLEKEFPGKQIVTLPLPGMRLQLRDTAQCKKRFGFKSDVRLFLFMFDGGSDFYRKNPDGVVRAFLAAFPKNGNERLVIKCHNIKPHFLRQLKVLAGSDSRISFLTKPLQPEGVEALMNACDVYISLHRSEGFGLTLLEALSLGKPVVCTNWSGNTDFCKREWSLLVDYRMIPVHKESEYYERIHDVGETCYWADPIHADAVSKLKEVARSYPKYKARAEKAVDWVNTEYYDLAKTATIINKYL